MGLQVEWYVPDRIIFVHGSGDITLQDVDKYNQEIVSRLAQSVAPVHLLLDIKELDQFPHNFIEMKRLLTHLDHQNLGWLIMFGAGKLETFLTSMIVQMSRHKIRFVASKVEALAFLAEIEPELPTE